VEEVSDLSGMRSLGVYVLAVLLTGTMATTITRAIKKAKKTFLERKIHLAMMKVAGLFLIVFLLLASIFVSTAAQSASVFITIDPSSGPWGSTVKVTITFNDGVSNSWVGPDSTPGMSVRIRDAGGTTPEIYMQPAHLDASSNYVRAGPYTWSGDLTVPVNAKNGPNTIRLYRFNSTTQKDEVLAQTLFTVTEWPVDQNATNLLDVKTKWDHQADTYAKGNYGSSWSEKGNCYGICNTEILYFLHATLNDPNAPSFPAQSTKPIHTNDLELPSDPDVLNNAALAILFHQCWDPGARSAVQSPSNSEFQKLVDSLKKEKPAIVGMDWSYLINPFSWGDAHAVVAYGIHQVNDNQFTIDISDPNGDFNELEYDTQLQQLKYSIFEKDAVYPDFVVMTPDTMQNFWVPSYIFADRSYISVVRSLVEFRTYGYYLVLSDKPITIKTNEGSGSIQQDYFTNPGDSSSFVCGISGSAGIAEGKNQLYAIPEGVDFTVSDPGTEQSCLMIAHVVNNAGQAEGRTFLLNLRSESATLNYTVTPSENSIQLRSTGDPLEASVLVCQATDSSQSEYRCPDTSIEQASNATFQINDWETLNDTLSSPVTVKVSPSQINSTLPAYLPYLAVGAVAFVVALAVIIVARRRLKPKYPLQAPVQVVICPNCRAQLNPITSYCTNCGQKLR
jgi:hypothetical protein